tara:strand:- start:195 stop:680 length:486 start_codon:yes stop_codon:yes gene_type:complete
MSNLKVEHCIKLIFFISLISIITAYFIEYVLGHQPCNLCLIERIPYGLSIVLIILNYTLIKNEKLVIFLLTIIFLFSLIVSVYHFGIEQGFFEESSVCGAQNNTEITSKDELLKQLQEKSVSCKDVTFRFFGLSLTSINIVLSTFLIGLLTKIFIFYEKHK